MTILNRAANRKRLKIFLKSVILSIVLMLLMTTCFPGTALAAGVGDVVTNIANSNFESPDFEFGAEEVTGYGFKMHAGYGGYANGYGGVSILGPVASSDMSILLNYVDGEAQHTSIQTTQLKGCEVREYTMEDGIGVGVVLPDYFITVEFYQTGNSSTSDFQKAKSVAQQVLDSLERAGLLSQPAPEIEKPSEEDATIEETAEAVPTVSPVVNGQPLDEPVPIANTDNIAGVGNGPTAPTTFTITRPHLVTYIQTYHWNSARGASLGLIGLKDQNGIVYGPWQATGAEGQGGVPNAYWKVYPNIVIPAGTYTITDSDPASWSANSESGGRGMAQVHATPNFEVTNGSLDELTGEIPGIVPIGSDYQESPAGVGSVGNIPGPSNTTEAVVGVAVPGLIATGLSVLAGFGGGGFTPSGGTPLSPNAGGSAPGGGGTYPGAGTPGSGTKTAGAVQETNQLGRRRRPGIRVDTDEMGQGSITVSKNDDIYVESADEAGIFVEPELRIDTDEMGWGSASVSINDDIYVETADEAAIFVEPELRIDTDKMSQGSIMVSENDDLYVETAGEAGVFIGTEQSSTSSFTDTADPGILIDTSAFDDLDPSAEVTSESGIEAGTQTDVSDTAAGKDSQIVEQGADDQKYGEEQTGIYDENGFDAEGFDRDGYNKKGYDHEGYNRAGFDAEGFDKEGFNAEGFDQAGYDRKGFNQQGFDKAGFDGEGYNQNGFDQKGFNREGFDQAGYDREGFNQQGFDKAGFDREGYNQNGYDPEGFNHEGFDQAGYDREGFNQKGFDKIGFDREGYNQNGYDQEGFNREGFDQTGYDREGFNQNGFDQEGYDREGFNQSGFDQEGFNREGFDKNGFDKDGFNKEGFDKTGFDKDGFNAAGFDAEGYDKSGFNQDGFDREGYGRSGYNSEGFDREGFDVNGYNAKGYNRSGFNAEGYNAAGYDKEGFNKDGWDAEGYGRNGLNKEGFDREGYDKNGYDKDGYDRDGYDREGRQQEGYDADGYDKKGFNKDGFDRDGYDRDGFDYEGYNRTGYDPWGYNKQGYGKDGYHWSGYNADGYNRDGRHWSENPFEGDGNPFNVATQDPFGEGEVIPFGTTWKPTKPALGEPYPKTLEKYGAKPWTDEPQIPESSANPAIPKPDVQDDTGFAAGPEDPQGTLDNHDVGTADSNTFTYTDPKTGETTTYEYEPGYTGPKHGQTQTLVGKADGQKYELEFDAVKGKWINTESGNEFNPDDFERWQNDLSIDKKQASKDLEKMANRQDANSKAIDKNLDDFNKLEKMQKAADKYNIGEPNGPGDVDKAIQKLKDDMLAGKELDQEKMDKIERVIDNRILGKTAADTGERWEEDWFKNLGWALEANAATAKEVITGEKDDGSISWLGMGARIMITAATGGLAGAGSLAPVVIDGGLTVAEAMYRIKDSIDKGESDFKAVSKAIGLVILGEEMGWLAGKAGGRIMGEMMERFPVFSNKAADFLETALLKASAKNQVWSKTLGLVSKESAEETLDQVNKRLVNIGSGEAAENIIKKARGDYGLSVADSFDDVSKAGKAVTGDGDEIFKGTGKSASDAGGNLATSSGRAASESSDDIAKSAGKASSGSDDIAKSGRTGNKAQTQYSPDAPPKNTAAGQDGTVRTGDASAEGPGDPGRPSSGGGEPGSPDDIVTGGPLNSNARTPEEVLADPAAISRAEHTVQNNIKDFDRLPPARKEELVREQAIYDEYKTQAQEKTYNLADKVERREGLTVEDIMEMKADPASMRTLKNIESTDGIGAELGQIKSRQVQSEFNEVLESKIHQPAYRDVESYLSNKLKTDNVRCRTVRTPGTEVTPWGVNTDNDVIAERLVNGPNGPEWVEIPKSEWQDRYNQAFAEHSGFSEQAAARRFPDRDWAGMDDAAKYKEWADLHEESAMDRFDPMAANDFSNQRTWIIEDGDLPGQLPGRNLVEASPEEIARGVDTVTIDGKQMRAASPYELAQRGEGNLVDSEQFGMMEKHKINDYWNKGSNPQEVMKNQTESLEQLQKTARAAQNVERSYRDMGYKVQSMPDNMQEAIKVINNNNLSPAARAARLQQLGYDTPGDFVEKVSSRIGAIRTAQK